MLAMRNYENFRDFGAAHVKIVKSDERTHVMLISDKCATRNSCIQWVI